MTKEQADRIIKLMETMNERLEQLCEAENRRQKVLGKWDAIGLPQARV